jgi:type II secretory pathway component PulF
MNKNLGKLSKIKISKNTLSLSDQILFAQRLSILLGSGISIVESLGMIQNIESSATKKQVYFQMIQSIQNGTSLSKTIKNIGLNFNNLLFVLIQNGENGGNLSDTLLQAYVYLNKKSELRGKIISSLVYPGFIVCATVVMALFLILYIFPKIIPLLSSLNIELPLMTRIVQMIYYFIMDYGLYSFATFVLLVFVFKITVQKSSSIKYYYHLSLISIPILHRYIKINMMIALCSMGEMLLSSGRGLQDLLLFSRDYNTNVVYKIVFENIYKESVQGTALTTSLGKYKKYFPIIFIDMVSIGERTGNLGMMFGHMAHIFEQDIENVLKRFTSLIEPILMVFMGIVVGSIALSIILPVYEITNHLSK